MIRLPGRFIFLCTPRCASRTVSKILQEQFAGEKLIGAHHANKGDCGALSHYDEPVVALMRHPYDYMMSRWAYHKRSEAKWRDEPWDHWFRWFVPDLNQREWHDRIAMYHKYVDCYYLFEAGIENFFQHVGLPHARMRHIGGDDHEYTLDWKIPVSEMKQKWKDDIDGRFADDMCLYYRVASMGPVDIPQDSHYNNSE